MKDLMFDALPVQKGDLAASRDYLEEIAKANVNRRNFIWKMGAAGLGVLGAASTAQAWHHRYNQCSYPVMAPNGFPPPGPGGFPPQNPPPPPPPPPPPVPPVQQPVSIEIAAGVTPRILIETVQGLVRVTILPAQVPQFAGAYPVPHPNGFHHRFGSDYALMGGFPSTRTRYGYYLHVDDYARADALEYIRGFKDLNYFEARRLMNPAEIRQFGMVPFPYGHRMAPTPHEVAAFQRVAHDIYGIPNPAAYNLQYSRLFSNGEDAYRGYFMSRGPDLRTPYKDLLIDALPA